MNKVVGRYHFTKVREFSGTDEHPVTKILADTIMTVTRTTSSGEICIHNYRLPLLPGRQEWLPGDFPWPNADGTWGYTFFNDRVNYYAVANFQAQSDSLVFQWYRDKDGVMRTYYGTRLP